MNHVHVETVRKIYEALGRGDVSSVLAHLSEGVVWEYGTIESGVPWLAHRRGREEAGEFFSSLGALDITKLEVSDVVAGSKVVLGLVNIDFTVKATGKKVEERDQVHVWRFDERGRVVSFRHAADTLAHMRASK